MSDEYFTPAASFPVHLPTQSEIDDVKKNLLEDLSRQSIIPASNFEESLSSLQDTSLKSVILEESAVKSNIDIEHIKVYLRIRPLLGDEQASAGENNCVTISDERTVIASAPQQSQAFRTSIYGLSRQQQKFTFSKVFGPETEQKQFYNETVRELVTEFVNGQNCLIFTYGVTNSGKTFTIHGDMQRDAAGILPQSLDQIFSTIGNRQLDIQFKPFMFSDVVKLSSEQIEKEKKLKESLLFQPVSSSASNLALSEGVNNTAVDETGNDVDNIMSDDSLESRLSFISDIGNVADGRIRYTVWVSFVEIYNEQIYDLLVPCNSKSTATIRPTALQLREDRDGRPFVRGLREIQVLSAEEARKLIDIGRRNLHIASTRLNRASSRSHCIFTLRLVEVVDVPCPSVARVATLSFCDLAGSERSTSTCVNSDRVKEAGNINSSLLTLGRCIERLKHNQSVMCTQQTLQARTKELSEGSAQLTLRGRDTIAAPFRESKLTRLFQNFLCGEGRVTMVINISTCCNVFDETLHALKYSALARQVIIIPAARPSHSICAAKRTSAAAGGKHCQSSSMKRHTSSASTSAMLKKRKTEELQTVVECEVIAEPVAACKTSESILTEFSGQNEVLDTTDDSELEEEIAECEKCEEFAQQHEKLIDCIKQLELALNDERKSKLTLETQVRQEVCAEMQKQLVRIESDYQEGLRLREEICEEKYERKMEIYMEAMQKSCKRQRRDDDEYSSGAGLRAANTKLDDYIDRVRELESTNKQLNDEINVIKRNFQNVCQDRQTLAQKLTEAEFHASAAETKLKLLESEAAQLISGNESKLSSASADENCHLLSQLEDAKHSIEKLTSEMNELKDSHNEILSKQGVEKSELELRLKKAMEELTRYEARAAQLEEGKVEIERLQNKVVSGEKNVERLVQDLSLRDEEVQDLRQKNEELNEMVNCHAQSLQVLNNELNTKKTAIEQLTSDIESLKCRIQMNESEIEGVNKQLLETVAECKSWKETCTALESRCQQQISSNCVMAESQQKLTTLQQRLDELETKLLAAENYKQSTDEKLIGVRDELRERQAELEECQKKMSQYQTEIEQCHCELKQHQTELKDNMNTLTTVRDELEQCKMELETCKKELDDKCNKLMAVNSEFDNCRAQLDIRTENIVELRAELEQCQTELKNIKIQMKGENDGLTDANRQLAETVKKLENSLHLAVKEKDNAESNCAMQTNQMSNLKEQLSSKKAELSNSDKNCKLLELELRASEQLVTEQENKIRALTESLSIAESKLLEQQSSVQQLTSKLDAAEASSTMKSRDASKYEEQIVQLKLTITEQELTAQFQDKEIQDKVKELDQLHDSITKLQAKSNDDIAKLLADNKCLQQELSKNELTKEQLVAKDRRIRDLEKEISKLEQQKQSLSKDVCDVTKELKEKERNAKEMLKELSGCKFDIEKLKKSKEATSTMNLAKDLIERDRELSCLRLQLSTQNVELDQLKCQVADAEKKLEMKSTEMAQWRVERDRIVEELQKRLIESAAAKRTKLSTKCANDDITKLERALSIKEQTNTDLLEQNLNLQKQISKLESDMAAQSVQIQQLIAQQESTASTEQPVQRQQVRKSRAKSTKPRAPLRAADNIDCSMSLLSDGHNAIDLDDTVGLETSRRAKKGTQRRLNEQNSVPVSPVTQPSLKAPKGHLGPGEHIVVPESPTISVAPARELRSRRVTNSRY